MADLLPSLSSEDERPNARDDSDDEEDNDEVDNSFQFGGILVSLLRRCRDENLAVIACRLPLAAIAFFSSFISPLTQ